jgi:chromosome transmission fidelity protein 18
MQELIAHQVRLEGFRHAGGKVSSPSPKPKRSSVSTTTQSPTSNQVGKPARISPEGTTPRKLEDLALAVQPPPKRSKTCHEKSAAAAANFLGIGAKRAKVAKSARKAAAIGVEIYKKKKNTHTGSGLLLSQVIRLKYSKGFTQAVRTPCRLQDLE